jgi:EAL domain-containing protein (putative c-di-GMP-specific phosphodiesterase class I)
MGCDMAQGYHFSRPLPPKHGRHLRDQPFIKE